MDINIALRLAICNLMTLKDRGSVDLDVVKTTLSTTFKDFIDIEEFVVGHIKGFLIKFEPYNVLAFKQSDDIYDWLHNIDIRTSEGFHRGFCTAANKVFITALRLTANKPFYLTGHSFGGAVTTVLTYWLADKPNFIASYVFGSPKVVTRRHSRLYEERTKNKLFTFRKYQDIFTNLPAFPHFTHVGTAFYINKEGILMPNVTPPSRALRSLKVQDIYAQHHIGGYVSALRKAR